MFFLKHKEKIILLIISIILFIFLFYLLKDNFKAKFWIIDDHEIISIIGKQKNFNILDFYKKTIVNDLQGAQRYRPTYWFIRGIEFSIFKMNPFYYYLFHFITIFIGYFFLLLTFNLLFKKNYILSFLLTFLVSIQGFWIDIYTRLSPTERYAFLYSSIWLYLLFRLNLKKTINHFDSISFFIFTTLSAFVKENFVFIFPISFFIFLYWYKNKKFSKTIFLIIFFLFFIIGLISVSFLITIKTNQYDVYSRPTSFLYRILITNNKLKNLINDISLIEIFLFSLLGVLINNKKRYINFILILLFFILGYFQYFVNLAEFSSPRYFFPLLILKYYFIPIFYWINLREYKNKNVIFYINLIFFIYMFLNIFINAQNITLLRNSIKNNMNRTNKFNFDLMKINKLYDKNKNNFYLVFDYTLPINIEFLHSIEKYLDFMNMKFNLYVIMPDDCNDNKFNLLEKKLCLSILNRIRDKNQNIKHNIIYRKYEDKNIYENSNNCVLFYLDPHWQEKINCYYEFNYSHYL